MEPRWSNIFLFNLFSKFVKTLKVLMPVKLQFHYYSKVSLAEMPEGWNSILKSNQNICKKMTVYSGGVEFLNFIFYFIFISSC